MDENEFVKKQIRNLNQHLPKARTSLDNLKDMDKPVIENRDGSTHRFKRKELDYLSNVLPEDDHKKLKLPIIIRVSPQLGRGASKISGEIEKKIVKEILEKKEEKNEDLLIYRPEVRKIRRKLPTTTQYAFMISSTGRKHHEK